LGVLAGCEQLFGLFALVFGDADILGLFDVTVDEHVEFVVEEENVRRAALHAVKNQSLLNRARLVAVYLCRLEALVVCLQGAQRNSRLLIVTLPHKQPQLTVVDTCCQYGHIRQNRSGPTLQIACLSLREELDSRVIIHYGNFAAQVHD